MNTNDLLQRWSGLSLEEIEDEILSGKNSDEVNQLLGAETVAEIRGVSFGPPPSGPREEVILLPGIMGSTLSSIRGVTTLVWINPLLFLKGKAQFLRLNADGTDDETTDVECQPVGLEKLTYLKIGIRLNREMHLHEFPYDWRRPMAYNAAILRERIERWANGDAGTKFTLVAHSMGGLVSRTYLALYPQDAEKRVKRLILHGTPNFGAANAIDTLAHGNSMLFTVDRLNSSNEMRQLPYCLPSVYQLLPAPPEYFPSGRTYPTDFDLYDCKAWPLEQIRQNYLDQAREMYKNLWASHPGMPIDVIAGGNIETAVSANAQTATGQPGLAMNTVGEGDNSGDGTVPLWSSLLPGAAHYFVQEVHRKLPGNNQVIQATLDLIRTGKCDLPTSLGPRKALAFSSQPPVSFELQADDLKEKIESGTAGVDDLEKFYFAY